MAESEQESSFAPIEVTMGSDGRVRLRFSEPAGNGASYTHSVAMNEKGARWVIAALQRAIGERPAIERSTTEATP